MHLVKLNKSIWNTNPISWDALREDIVLACMKRKNGLIIWANKAIATVQLAGPSATHNTLAASKLHIKAS